MEIKKPNFIKTVIRPIAHNPTIYLNTVLFVVITKLLFTYT